MNLIAESSVVDAGGEDLGRLAGVSVNPGTNQVAELLVSAPGGGFVTLVPAHLASRIDGDVQLSVSERTFRGLTHGFTTVERSMGSSVAEHEFARVMLLFGIDMRCVDGPIGKLFRVLCDVYTFDIEELVIGPSQWLDHEVGVPMEWVERLGSRQIVLSCTREEVMTQPGAPDDL